MATDQLNPHNNNNHYGHSPHAAAGSVRVWQSYSCNNSSSFRLVAKFGDPKKAADSAAELTTFFKQHGKQADKQADEIFSSGQEYNWPPPATKAMAELATKYGFKWKDFMGWGDGEYEGDEPVAVAADNTLVIYHSYCSGFPSELTTYLKAKGANKVAGDDWSAPTVTAMFQLPTKKNPAQAKKLVSTLSKLFAQANDPENEYIYNWKIKAPWAKNDRQPDASSTETAFFSDGKTAGFHIPIDPENLDALKKYLAKNGVDSPSLLLCEENELDKLKAIASAKCEACASPLTYIDPRLNDIEAEQLACDKCGGMYDLAEVTKKAVKVAKAAEKKAAAAAKAEAEAKAAEEKSKKRKKSAAKRKKAAGKATPKKAASKKAAPKKGQSAKKKAGAKKK